ncbi:MAG: DUF1016 family protein [Solobacterium sp.]|nr:DUF1016 family protein [Solobacterium sp.]
MTNNSLDILVDNIVRLHNQTGGYAKSAVNQLLTIRNWVIGYYIVEFEQNGSDRAAYGTGLLETLSEKLSIKGLDRTVLNLCRIFYLKYPQICDSVNHRLTRITGEQVHSLPSEVPAETVSIPAGKKRDSQNHRFQTDPEVLLTHLSFTHLRQIMTLDDPLERYFYEFECIRGTWSVRELKRQIATNLYVRAGISKKPELLISSTVGTEETLSIREPMTLEFLGLDAKEAVTESDLEQALIDHLQEFILELGRGFCFEARQKRIMIDGDYYFPDLVFYNRLLHCSVIVELKNDEFSHEYLGQLNSYVGYYKENEMVPGDNPPIGILLCTRKGKKMVEYALSGMDNQLFVSTYLLQLPDREQLESFLLKQIDELGL